MEQHKRQDDMKEAILQKIRGGEVQVRSRLHIALSIAALAAVAVALLVVSVLIINYITFSIRINQHDALLGFGTRGVTTFLALFPWWLLVLDLVLVVIGEWLLRSFKFGYRIPVLYLLIALVLLVGVIGVVLDRATPLNDHLLDRADKHELPYPLGELFEGVREVPPPGSGICHCIVLAVGTSSVTAYDEHQGTSTIYTVLLPPHGFRATTSLSVGQELYVAGDTDGSIIRAYGIRPRLPAPKVPRTLNTPHPQPQLVPTR